MKYNVKLCMRRLLPKIFRRRFWDATCKRVVGLFKKKNDNSVTFISFSSMISWVRDWRVWWWQPESSIPIITISCRSPSLCNLRLSCGGDSRFQRDRCLRKTLESEFQSRRFFFCFWISHELIQIPTMIKLWVIFNHKSFLVIQHYISSF